MTAKYFAILTNQGAARLAKRGGTRYQTQPDADGRR